jgi:hypothetical protein
MLRLLHHMSITEPRTMAQLLADGYTRDQVYNAVKRGQLVNLAARDAWGRRTRGPGLFSNPAAPAYNAGPLLSAWHHETN